MEQPSPLTLTLPEDQIADLRARVAAGQYADEAAAVSDALRIAFGRDAALEAWLKTEVVAAWDEHQDDPGAAVPAEDIMQELERRRTLRPGTN